MVFSVYLLCFFIPGMQLLDASFQNTRPAYFDLTGLTSKLGILSLQAMDAPSAQHEIHLPETIAGLSSGGCTIIWLKHYRKGIAPWNSYLTLLYNWWEPVKVTIVQINMARKFYMRTLDELPEDFLDWVSRRNVKTLDGEGDNLGDTDATPIAAASLGLTTSEVRPGVINALS